MRRTRCRFSFCTRTISALAAAASSLAFWACAALSASSAFIRSIASVRASASLLSLPARSIARSSAA